jgi:hypothetical protein
MTINSLVYSNSDSEVYNERMQSPTVFHLSCRTEEYDPTPKIKPIKKNTQNIDSIFHNIVQNYLDITRFGGYGVGLEDFVKSKEFLSVSKEKINMVIKMAARTNSEKLLKLMQNTPKT